MKTRNTEQSTLIESASHQRLRKLSVAFSAMQSAAMACFLARDLDGFAASLELEREILAEQEQILEETRRSQAKAEPSPR